MSAPTLARGLSPVRTVLPNNVVAIAQQNVAAPAVAISTAFRAGSIHDPASLPGLSYLMSLVVDRGTSPDPRTPSRRRSTIEASRCAWPSPDTPSRSAARV